ARAYGPGKRDRARAQRLPVVRNEQVGGLCPGKIRSENGFSAIVQHSLPTAQEPRCMDAEGTRTHLPPHPQGGRAARAGKEPRGDPVLRRRCVRQGHLSAAARLPSTALARETVIAQAEIARATVRDLERRAKRGGKR